MLYRVHGGAEVKLGGAVDMAFERLFVIVIVCAGRSCVSLTLTLFPSLRLSLSRFFLFLGGLTQTETREGGGGGGGSGGSALLSAISGFGKGKKERRHTGPAGGGRGAKFSTSGNRSCSVVVE